MLREMLACVRTCVCLCASVSAQIRVCACARVSRHDKVWLLPVARVVWQV